MKKTLLVFAAFLVLAVPAALAVPPANHGNQGGSGNGNSQGADNADKGKSESNAAHQCKAELKSLGAAAFADKYGTNANKHNAFGKCVSQHAKAKSKSSSDDD